MYCTKNQYHVIQHRVFSVFTDEPKAKVYLGIGDPSNDYNSTITVYIMDNYHGMAIFSFPVQVRFLDQEVYFFFN